MTFKYKLERHQGDSEPRSVTKLIDTNIALNIPFDPDNTDYQEYLEWVAAGNTAEAAD